MSKYTTEVRFICESLADNTSSGADSVDEVISVARSKIFDFAYPIFDENYKSVLESKILKHYYTREICAETYGLWKLWLNQKMNDIMPYYNKLYESELINFNPLNSDNLSRSRSNTYKETHSDNNNSSGSVNNQGTNNNNDWSLYSDTPQGGLNGIDQAVEPSVANNAYLTNARRNIASGNSSNNQTSEVENTSSGGVDSTNTYLETVSGYSGVDLNDRLKKYRDNFLNIDLMIIEELSDLFFNLW